MQLLLVAKLCLTLVTPWAPIGPQSGSSVHGISQEKILEWVAIFSLRGSSQPRGHTHVSGIAGGFFILYHLDIIKIKFISLYQDFSYDMLCESS